MKRQTFYFDTGVKPYNFSPPVKLMEGQILRGTIQIPFDCIVPENAIFQFASNNEQAGNGLFKAEILSGKMISKWVFFKIPV